VVIGNNYKIIICFVLRVLLPAWIFVFLLHAQAGHVIAVISLRVAW